MTDTIDIPANEAGLVRIFALSMDAADAQQMKDTPPSGTGTSPTEEALGAAALDGTHIEVFSLADLGEMTLPEYLVEGAGITAEALAHDRSKLAALDGWVMILYSSALGGTAQHLNPVPALTLIGTYPQEGIDWSPEVGLSTPSALPYQQSPGPVRKKPSDAAMAGRIATAALLVLFALVGLMVWVGS
jgi:hypothetical protein